MGTLTWVNLILPFLKDFFKTFLNPSSEGNRTTSLERFSILINIVCFCMLALLGEKLYTLHDEKMEFSGARSNYELMVTVKDNRIEELEAEVTGLRDRLLTKSVPPKSGIKTVSTVPTVKAPVSKPKVSNSHLRELMIKRINGQ